MIQKIAGTLVMMAGLEQIALAQASVPGWPSGVPAAVGPTVPFGAVTSTGIRSGPVAPVLGFTPGFGIAATPTISPYLNLARAGNPAVNYYYGVRPWQAASAFQQAAAQPQPLAGFSQTRGGFIPAAATPSETPTELPPAGEPVTLPPSGHPVVFGNRFGTLIGNVPGVQPGSNRPGIFSQQPPPMFNRSSASGPGRSNRPPATMPRIP